MQRIDVYIQNIAVFVNDAHCFLELAVYFEFLQAAVTANTMIDMRYKISGLKITKRFQG